MLMFPCRYLRVPTAGLPPLLTECAHAYKDREVLSTQVYMKFVLTYVLLSETSGVNDEGHFLF